MKALIAALILVAGSAQAEWTLTDAQTGETRTLPGKRVEPSQAIVCKGDAVNIEVTIIDYVGGSTIVSLGREHLASVFNHGNVVSYTYQDDRGDANIKFSKITGTGVLTSKRFYAEQQVSCTLVPMKNMFLSE